MSKYFFTSLCIFLSWNVVFGQTDSTVIVENPVFIVNQNQVGDSVYLKLVKYDKYFEIKITNTLSDTIYLFDSYLTEDLVCSQYLHRIDKKNKTYKVSFIPIISYLSVERADAIIIGRERIIRRNQVLYSFKAIPPKMQLCIKIAQDVFDNNEFVVDFNAKKITKFDNPVFKTVKKIDVGGFCKLIEFAVYKDITLLSSRKSYYLDEYNFNKQAQSFIILTNHIAE